VVSLRELSQVGRNETKNINLKNQPKIKLIWSVVPAVCLGATDFLVADGGIKQDSST
jgi:hypothetical protein